MWRTEEIFVTVKAYPTISKTHYEACCVAGVTRKGDWIRLYPVPFRELESHQQFQRYTWIEAKIQKSRRDFREESHNVDVSSIRQIEKVGTKNNWRDRNKILEPLIKGSNWVFRQDRDLGSTTLSMVRINQILRLEIEEVKDEDYKKQLGNLNRAQNQLALFPSKDLTRLEIVPYSFRYVFLDDAGTERNLKIVDWEIYQLFRKVKTKPNWQNLLREKYVDEFRSKDVCLFTGTVHVHPQNWLAIGVYYPPKPIASTGEQLEFESL